MSDNIVASVQISTAQQFRAAAEARRAAQKTLEASLPADKLARIIEAHQRIAVPLMPRTALIAIPFFEEFRRTIAMHEAVFQSIAAPYTRLNQAMTAWQSIFTSSLVAELQRSRTGFVEFNLNFEAPQFIMPDELQEAVIDSNSVTVEPNGKLKVSIDQFGNFIFGGHIIYRANANGSQHGKMLRLLESHKGELVSHDEIKANFKTGTTRDIMKNLKKDMRELGYQLDYKAYPRQGLVYHGVMRHPRNTPILPRFRRGIF